MELIGVFSGTSICFCNFSDYNKKNRYIFAIWFKSDLKTAVECESVVLGAIPHFTSVTGNFHFISCLTEVCVDFVLENVPRGNC